MSIQSVRNSVAAANRRRSRRVYDGGNQLRVKAAHGEGRTNNFSREGFLADGIEEYEADGAVEGTLQAPGGKQARFQGKIVRVEEDGMRTVQLVNFDSEALLMCQGAGVKESATSASASSRAYSSADRGSGDSNPSS